MAEGIGATLQQHVGPLPVWAWGAGVLGGILVVVRMNKSASKSSGTGTGQPIVGTPTTTATLDPTSVALLGQLSSQLQTMQNNAGNQVPGSSTGSTSSGSGSSNPSQPTQSNPGQQPWSWLQQWLQGQQQVSIQPIGTPTSGGPPYVGNPGGQSGEAPWTPGHPSATGAAQFFAAFHLPQWIAAQWVAEHGGVLPWNPGTTPTPAQQQALNDWLNAKGYRDPQSGAFLPVVSSPSIPQPVAQEIQAAGINWGP